jgi:Alpha/beta hydrolase domain
MKQNVASKRALSAGRMRRWAAAWVGLAVAVSFAGYAPAEAKVTQIVIDQRESPTYAGAAFGTVGQYEKLIGRAFGEIDPNDRRNAIIQDIQLAPRNANGKVAYVATFTLIKPLDMAKGNDILLYQVVNRGSRLQAFNIGGDPGDGFVQDHGYTLLWSGWQGDVAPAANHGNETVQVPAAKNADGSPVTGPVIFRFWNEPAGTHTIRLNVPPPGAFTGVVYQPASLDTSKATLEKHAAESTTAVTGAIVPVPSSDWAWADCSSVPFPGTPDPTKICLKDGFDPSFLYQLVYTAKDPLVLGVGLAAMRDIVSFFRHATQDDLGTANPVANHLSYVLGQGTSQSGNLLKTFIHLGFNEDEQGRIVFQGANDYIAARQTPINYRFALPGGAAALFEPGSEPVLWWHDWPDKVRDRPRAGMLDRCRETDTCPKIVETFGATEFWDLRMSPGLVGTDARQDIPLPHNVRRYWFPGTTHGGGPGGFSTTVIPGSVVGCTLPFNPNPEIDTQRALFAALADWVVEGKKPPHSRYPRLDNGLLVHPTKAAMGFPTIPGLPFTDNFENPVLDYDLGPKFIYNDMSGVITNEPPTVKQVITTLVPRVNTDGNEMGGVPSVLHQAPLGTYLGWNIMAAGFFEGQICAFTGGFVPFAKSAADRAASHDPRLSLEERYGTQDGYNCAVRLAAKGTVAQRLLLQADADRLIVQAAASNVLPTTGSASDNRTAALLCSLERLSDQHGDHDSNDGDDD